MDAISPRSTSSLRDAAGRYRQARRSLHTPASARSRRGLDWMNFFIADVQTGFGSFVAFYLAQLDWSPARIGIALSVGTLAGMLSQIPGGALADAVTWKRGLAAVGIVMTAVAALILAFAPGIVAVFVAQILQGATAGIITPAIGAISLGLVGRSAMSVRTGRNYRYAAAGHALTGALMGVAGAYIATSAIFVSAAALCIPASDRAEVHRQQRDRLCPCAQRQRRQSRRRQGSATRIGGARVQLRGLDHPHPRPCQKPGACSVHRRDRSLPACRCLDAADDGRESSLTTRGDHAAIWMSGLIVVPQIVVAIWRRGSASIRRSEGGGRCFCSALRSNLLRGLVLAFSTAYPALVVAQILSGMTGAVIGVLTVIVVADLTAGTGRFNLATGTFGALSGIAASLSTIGAGFVFQVLGSRLGYAAACGRGGAGDGLLVDLPSTRRSRRNTRTSTTLADYSP